MRLEEEENRGGNKINKYINYLQERLSGNMKEDGGCFKDAGEGREIMRILEDRKTREND